MPPASAASMRAGAPARAAHAIVSVVLAARPILALPVPALLGTQSPLDLMGHGGGGGGNGGEPVVPRTNAQLVLDILSIAGLVLLGGVFAGLTLGLMGLDMVNLQVMSTSGNETEQRHAKVVLNLLEKGRHWVLVVLLLGNVIVNETLPVFLSDFGGGLSAVLTSTLLIVIFGEIVPQAICARYGLLIGAYCAPMVHAVMILLAPIAWPTARLLDWCLGEEQGTVYRKAELKTFVSLHQALGEETLTNDEVTIIRAVLDLNEKCVRDIMTPVADVMTLPSDAVLDEAGVANLVDYGYSRIPVHEPNKPDAILGMLLVKNLISYDPEDAYQVSRFQLAALPEAPPDLSLFDCLNYFQQGRSHMLLVSEYPGEPRGALGVVTLEDVIEEMIGREIVDEFDVYMDVHNKIKVTRSDTATSAAPAGSWQPLIRGIIERRRNKRIPTRHSTYGMPSTPSPLKPGSVPGAGTNGSTPLMTNGSSSAGYGALSNAGSAPVHRVQIKRAQTFSPGEIISHTRPRSNSTVSTGDLLPVPVRDAQQRRGSAASTPTPAGENEQHPVLKPTPISALATPVTSAKSLAEQSEIANQPVAVEPVTKHVDESCDTPVRTRSPVEAEAEMARNNESVKRAQQESAATKEAGKEVPKKVGFKEPTPADVAHQDQPGPEVPPAAKAADSTPRADGGGGVLPTASDALAQPSTQGGTELAKTDSQDTTSTGKTSNGPSKSLSRPSGRKNNKKSKKGKRR